MFTESEKISEYERRIVAFADILGWRAITQDKECTYLYEVVNSIKKHADNFSEPMKETIANAPGFTSQDIAQHSGIEFSFFSDSLAVSAPVACGEFLFKILSWACDRLLSKGLLVRGGVTIGDVWHRERIIFGPALVEAVEMEETTEHPRLLCSEKLVKYLCSTDYKDVIIQDSSQKWVVNVACGSSIALDDLMAIVRCKSYELEKIMRKWRYVQEMLPKMYDAKKS